MVVDRKFKAPLVLRIALPALVLAGLGAAAAYFNPTPVRVIGSDHPLFTTGTTLVEPAVAHEGDCPMVNDFVITITGGSPSCDEITKVAKPYTNAVLNGDPLGTALMWSGHGWECTRNYGDSDSMWNAHGMVCNNGPAAFTLVSD